MRNKLRLEKRESVSTIRIVLTSILFTLIAFAFCGIIIASVGFNPLEVYGKLYNVAAVLNHGELLGIVVHDHIIVGNEQYYSFSESGRL